jgi:hypothetical protein
LLFFAKYSLGNDFFQLGIHLESVEVKGVPVTLRAVVVEQPLLPGGATDRSPDPTHGVSPKALKNLPADVGLFSFSEEHLRLPHLDSRWITVSPTSDSGQTCASSGNSGTTPSAGDFGCPTSPFPFVPWVHEQRPLHDGFHCAVHVICASRPVQPAAQDS